MWLMALVEISAWLGFTRLKECSLLWVETSPLRMQSGKTVCYGVVGQWKWVYLPMGMSALAPHR